MSCPRRTGAVSVIVERTHVACVSIIEKEIMAHGRDTGAITSVQESFLLALS